MKSFELRQLLAERYPNAFKPKGAQKLPLKIGIHNEIVAANPELTAEEVRAGLADYTGGPKYLEHLLPGAVRIGLDGSPAGTVTEREANWARIRLKHLRATWARKDTRRNSKQRVNRENNNGLHRPVAAAAGTEVSSEVGSGHP